MKKLFLAIIMAVIGSALLTSCMKSMGGQGGEVTGVRGRAWNEPQPFGMVLVKRGSMEVGAQEKDSLWGDQSDAYFPNLDKDEEWELVNESDEETYYDLDYTYRLYERKKK